MVKKEGGDILSSVVSIEEKNVKIPKINKFCCQMLRKLDFYKTVRHNVELINFDDDLCYDNENRCRAWP